MKRKKSERPVDALAVEKGELIAHNLESRDARASKKGSIQKVFLNLWEEFCKMTQLFPFGKRN